MTHNPKLQNMTHNQDRSYAALFREVPSVGRLLTGMQIARTGQEMVSIALVLFTLSSYRSPVLAGMATFFMTFPGLLISPIAGALLDRHGRTRLVILDYLITFGALALMGVLALNDSLPVGLLMAIAGVASLTSPLSNAGVRSLFPLIVPPHLWERVNAIDSTGYVLASILGPPLAAALMRRGPHAGAPSRPASDRRGPPATYHAWRLSMP